MISFKLVKQTYIQKGAIQLKKTYYDGKAHVQGAENILGQAELNNPKLLPEYFMNDWAQLMYPVDTTLSPELVYDKGAYQIGVPYETEYLNIPKFYPVYLLYFINTNATNPIKELVSFDPSLFVDYEEGSPSTVVDAEAFVEKLTTTVWGTEQEYADWLHSIPGAIGGFNRSGKVYPPGVSKTAVSELLGMRAKVDYIDQNGAPQTGVIDVNVAPSYVQNSRPIFDVLYLVTDVLYNELGENAAKNVLLPGRLLRLRGATPSEVRAPINWTDDSLGGNVIDQGTNIHGVNNPAIPTPLTIDGVSYKESGAYNVSNKPGS